MRLIRSVLAVFALGALAVPVLAQRAEGTVVERVDAVLEATGRPGECARAADQLARLGVPALGPIFDRLRSDPPPGDLHRASLLAALGMLPRESVLTFVSDLARPATDERTRIAALDLVARLGGRGELKLAIELAAPVGAEAPPARALVEALERVFVALSSRDAGTFRDLASFFGRVEPAVQTAIVEAIQRSGRGDVPSLLAGFLGRASAGVDALLLSELADFGRHGSSEDLLVHERVRGYLGHPNKTLATLACSATSSLVDDGAVPDLIVLLCEDDPNVRRAAHAALKDLTGLGLAPEPHAWMSWLDESLAWWDERADPCRAALVSGTATEAAAALQEVARQRLHVHEVVKMIGLALQRSEKDIVESACSALRGVPASAARVALLALASLSDSEITRVARDALSRPERARPSPTRAIALPRTRSIHP